MRPLTPGAAAAGCRRRLTSTPRSPAHQVGAVERAVQPERLAQLAGPAAQVPVPASGRAPCGAHLLQPGQRGQASQQHGRRLPVVAADHVGAEVHAVGEVDVQVPGRAEHGGVAGRRAPEGVAGRVGGSGVGLDLDDARRPARPAPAPCSAAVAPAPGCRHRRTRAAGVPGSAGVDPDVARRRSVAMTARLPPGFCSTVTSDFARRRPRLPPGSRRRPPAMRRRCRRRRVRRPSRPDGWAKVSRIDPAPVLASR